MPSIERSTCRHPSCPGNGQEGERGYCKAHSTPRPNPRLSRKLRGYDETWLKGKDAYFMAHPWCSDCKAEGVLTPATDRHHIHKLKLGGEHFLWSNLMPLCKSHHSLRTRRGE